MTCLGPWLPAPKGMVISPKDILGLLMRVGRDTAGVFRLANRDERELERIINELLERAFLIGERGLSMSLAGVQDKAASLYRPRRHNRHSARRYSSPPHILKPDIKRLAVMILAKLCGLNAAEATIGRVGKRDYLLVRRYDRVSDRQGTIRRIQYSMLPGRAIPMISTDHKSLRLSRGASAEL